MRLTLLVSAACVAAVVALPGAQSSSSATLLERGHKPGATCNKQETGPTPCHGACLIKDSRSQEGVCFADYGKCCQLAKCNTTGHTKYRCWWKGRQYPCGKVRTKKCSSADKSALKKTPADKPKKEDKKH